MPENLGKQAVLKEKGGNLSEQPSRVLFTKITAAIQKAFLRGLAFQRECLFDLKDSIIVPEKCLVFDLF
ncbi:MAG TPA: hypothetical protein PLZ15_04885 [Melioribacteraceae bacterium]|nr:hypothetical protein [Melioribacteraceae bacterium]